MKDIKMNNYGFYATLVAIVAIVAIVFMFTSNNNVVQPGLGELDSEGGDLLGQAYGSTEIQPILHYNFNQGSGNKIFDRTGRGNDGIINGANWSSECVDGNCLNFDGQNDFVTVADSSDLDLTQGTIMFWIKGDSLATGKGNWDMILGKEGSGQEKLNNYGVWVTPYTTIRGSIGDTTKHLPAVDARLKNNVWYHFTYTFDSSTVNTYLNGELIGSKINTITPRTNNKPLIIGSFKGRHVLDGKLDELKIFNRALLAKEIKFLYDFDKCFERSIADVDGDYKVTINDSNITMNAAVGLIDFNSNETSQALAIYDVNSDRKVSYEDIEYIMDISVGFKGSSKVIDFNNNNITDPGDASVINLQIQKYDLNKDGILDKNDVAIVINLGDGDGDVDGDGIISVDDALLIWRMSEGLERIC
ncbi:LamG domain-containing protein [Nanoarchaeota archaeon]